MADTGGEEAFPRDGMDAAALDETLLSMARLDSDAAKDIGFGRRFFPGEDVAAIAARACGLFAGAGRASPYPGLPSPPSMARMQRDLTRWTLELLNAPDNTAVLFTSGGTESVIMAAHAARRHAGKSSGGRPEIIASRAAHPCIDKAASLFDLNLIRTPTGRDWRADLKAMEDAITPRTMMLYASFPSYAYGIEDDIEALAALARDRGIWLHIDACMSGFLAPFMRMNGETIPKGGLEIPGVTSVSADLHKHGYSAKGASVVAMPAAAAEKSAFIYSNHPLPPMATPTLAGTAPGAPLASAWAVMRYLGEPGFRALAAELSAARQSFVTRIRDTEGFGVLGDPLFSIVVVTSEKHDMNAVHAGMAKRGWFLSKVGDPPGLHLNISAKDGPLAMRFAEDLRAASRAP